MRRFIEFDNSWRRNILSILDVRNILFFYVRVTRCLNVSDEVAVETYQIHKMAAHYPDINPLDSNV
jgi:hypothetical protein